MHRLARAAVAEPVAPRDRGHAAPYKTLDTGARYRVPARRRINPTLPRVHATSAAAWALREAAYAFPGAAAAS
jgi:hypothetical protein